MAEGHSRLTKQLLAWAPAVIWAALLFFLSSLSEWPGGSRFVDLPDKVVHGAFYAVLGAALAHGRYHGAPRLPHAALIALGVLYGASDEWHQSFVPGRMASVGDFAADAVGTALGYGVAWTIAVATLRRRSSTAETEGKGRDV